MEAADERMTLEQRLPLPVLPPRAAAPELIVMRDPFGSASPPVPDDSADPLVLPLPANRGAANVPQAVFGDEPMVRALITGGAAPRALLDENGQVRIVEIGDAVQGSAITAIDSAGILLKNGTRYALSQENQ